MEDVFLTDDVVVPVPDEVFDLMQEINEICINQQCNHAIPALWLMLLAAIIQSRECTFQQGIEHAQKLVLSGRTCDTREEAIAAYSLSH
jgi:hypothetical protein